MAGRRQGGRGSSPSGSGRDRDSAIAPQLGRSAPRWTGLTVPVVQVAHRRLRGPEPALGGRGGRLRGLGATLDGLGRLRGHRGAGRSAIRVKSCWGHAAPVPRREAMPACVAMRMPSATIESRRWKPKRAERCRSGGGLARLRARIQARPGARGCPTAPTPGRAVPSTKHRAGRGHRGEGGSPGRPLTVHPSRWAHPRTRARERDAGDKTGESEAEWIKGAAERASAARGAGRARNPAARDRRGWFLGAGRISRSQRGPSGQG